jgi:hypothetical protein
MNRRLGLTLLLTLCVFIAYTSAGTIAQNGQQQKVRKLKVRSASSSSPVHHKTTSESKSDSSSSSFDTTRALIKTAKALARSHSTSEVLTLNLTNLLILVVLKAIIFGIGLFYFGGVSFKGGHGGEHGGGGGGHGWGRALDEKQGSFMSQSELLLMLTYVLGSTNNDNYECMYRVACEDPAKAKDYLNASNMLLKGAKYAKK